MKRVLEELFYGNIDPCEISTSTETYRELSKELSALTSRFSHTLPSEYHDELNFVLSKQHELSFYLEKELFCFGFCLGARMISETMCFEDF